jgi:hypothetical protein
LTAVLGAAGRAPSAHADPDDVNAQIDMIGVPWLMIGEDPSPAPIA